MDVNQLVIYTYCPFKSLAILESDSGGLLVLEETSLLRTVEQKAESVLLFKNRNNYRQKNAIKLGCLFMWLFRRLLTLMRRWEYKLVLLVLTLFEFLILPLFTRSIPCIIKTKVTITETKFLPWAIWGCHWAKAFSWACSGVTYHFLVSIFILIIR